MLCPNWGFRPCAGTGPGVNAERVASAAAIAITGGGGHKAVEHDQDGRLLCPAALWGKACRYFQSGTCKFSHAVPAALAAGYAARRTQQRVWEEARRADARAHEQNEAISLAGVRVAAIGHQLMNESNLSMDRGRKDSMIS